MSLTASIQTDDTTNTVSLIYELDKVEVTRYTSGGETVAVTQLANPATLTIQDWLNGLRDGHIFTTAIFAKFSPRTSTPPEFSRQIERTPTRVSGRFDAGLVKKKNGWVTELDIDLTAKTVLIQPRPALVFTLDQFLAWRIFLDEMLRVAIENRLGMN